MKKQLVFGSEEARAIVARDKELQQPLHLFHFSGNARVAGSIDVRARSEEGARRLLRQRLDEFEEREIMSFEAYMVEDRGKMD